MTLTVTENDADQRLDRFLRKAYKATPLSLIQKAIRKGLVKVNNRKKANTYMLAEKDRIEIDPSVFKQKQKKAGKADPEFKKWILFENKSIIILNKPAGLPVHGGTGQSGETLISLLSGYLKTRSLTFAPAFVHRLDKETSGVITAAKTAAALRAMSKLFRERSVIKIYTALITGCPKPLFGTLQMPVKGKAAHTVYRTVGTLGGRSHLELELHTGRTRQIREHLKEAGYPIIGDKRYGGEKAGRLMLHASGISFSDPETEKTVTAEAPLPEAFTAAMRRR